MVGRKKAIVVLLRYLGISGALWERAVLEAAVKMATEGKVEVLLECYGYKGSGGEGMSMSVVKLSHG